MDYCLSECALSEENHRRLLAALVADVGLTLYGQPGCGSTLLARRIATLRPDAPFRAPHYTISEAALLGTPFAVGELELARDGVLYLDQLTDFSARPLRTLAASTVPFTLVASIDSGLDPEAWRAESLPFRAVKCPVWLALPMPARGKGMTGIRKTSRQVAEAIAAARARRPAGPWANSALGALAYALAQIDDAPEVTAAHREEAGRYLARPASATRPTAVNEGV